MAVAAHVRRPSDFALDPIYLNLIVDPVTDQCGHSFSRSTIDALVATGRPGDPVLCPLSRKVIDVAKLFENHLAKEALDYCDQLENTAYNLHEDLISERRASEYGRKQIVKEFDHRLDIQRREFAHRFSLKQDDLDYEKKERKIERAEFIANMQEMMKAIKSSDENVKSLTKEVKHLTRRLDLTESRNRRLQLADRRKSKNLREMTYRDKLLISFGECLGAPDHIQTVLDRGIKKV